VGPKPFDIFNHPAPGGPNLHLDSSSLGIIVSARFPTCDFGSSGQLQPALQLMF
jgi:hypothetical protein